MLLSNDCMRPINSTPILIYDIVFFIVLFPFVGAGLHYAYKQSLLCLVPTFPGLNVSMDIWLRVDSFVLLGFTFGALCSAYQKCCTIATRCTYIIFVIGNSLYIAWRLAWLIVGSVLFWKHIRPSGLCGGPLNGYMWAVLIIGFVHLVAITIFLIVYRPEPLILPPPPVVPTFTQPVMMTSQALGPTVFRGPGLTLGQRSQAFYY